jgi:hypothetical protein
MVKIKPSQAAEMDSLLKAEDYSKSIG